MAPPNNNNDDHQEQEDGFTTVVRSKRSLGVQYQYSNSSSSSSSNTYSNDNNDNSNNSSSTYSNDNKNNSINKGSSSWTPIGSRPVLTSGPTFSSGTGTSAGEGVSYPNSRLRNRAPLSTIDQYAATQETPSPNPNPTTANTTATNNIPTPFLKSEDDEAMSTTSTSSWGSLGSWSSDNTNNNTSSFDRSWSYDSRSYGRRRAQGNGQYYTDNYSSHDHYNNKDFGYWKKYKTSFREPRNLDVFLTYVRETNPISVPLSDRYDGGSCYDVDDASDGSIMNPSFSHKDLTKDGYDDKNENHWIDAKTMVLKDKFPKAHFHALVLPNRVVPTLNQLICRDGVMIVKQLVERGKIIIARESKRSPHLQFKMGFHAVPTMRQVHMHVISTDMDSENAYKINIYNSYTTEFFLTPDQVIRTIESKWKSRDLEFLTKKEKSYYESWIHNTLPWCLECQGNPFSTASVSAGSAASASQARRLQDQGLEQAQGHRVQAWPIHKHADPDMDAELHNTTVELHKSGIIVTSTPTSANLVSVPDAIIKNKEKQPTSTTATTTITAAITIVAAAGLQVVRMSATTTANRRGRTRASWATRHADFALLRQHLRMHYLRQKQKYFSPYFTPPSLSPSPASSPDLDLENGRNFFHDMNNYDNDRGRYEGGRRDEYDVLSGTNVPLMLNHDALSE